MYIFLLVPLFRHTEGGLSRDPNDFFMRDFSTNLKPTFCHENMTKVFACLPYIYKFHCLILCIFHIVLHICAIAPVKWKNFKRYEYKEINFSNLSKNLPLKKFRILSRLLIFYFVRFHLFRR